MKEKNMAEDFVSDTLIGIEIDGTLFKIRELSGDESDKASSEYITVNSDGNLVADIPKRNRLWLGLAVADAPYKKDGKEFKDLKVEEKSDLLQLLKPKIRLPLIQAITDINTVGRDVAKNYKKQS